MKKRPFAYISIPWSGNVLEALQMADDACRAAYESGLTPRCPKRDFMRFLDTDRPQELKDMKDMSHEVLRRCTILVVCGKTMLCITVPVPIPRRLPSPQAARPL